MSATCRFATDTHTAQDLRGTLRALPVRWRWLLTGLPPEAIDAVAGPLRAAANAVGATDTSFESLAAAAGAVSDDRAFDVVHATEHAFEDAGRALAPFVRSHAGTVAGLFASDGGVPKTPIAEAVVGRRGVAGDRQATRKHHGRVSQALCLWSADLVDALAAEGHPIVPGAAGENASVRGVDWGELRPGVRLRLGTVLAEVSGWALPSAKNARWFAGGDFRRIDPDLRPGWARAYATVVEDGVIRPGDAAVVEP